MKISTMGDNCIVEVCWNFIFLIFFSNLLVVVAFLLTFPHVYVFFFSAGETRSEKSVCSRRPHHRQFGLLLGVEDTGQVTIEHCLANLLFLLYSSFFCPFFLYCYRLTVSSTPSKSHSSHGY